METMTSVADDPPQTRSQLRAEIARVRKEIARADRVFLLVSLDYHSFTHGVYVRVSKADARRIVGMCPEHAEPFKLTWDNLDLYIPPAYAEES